MPPIEIEQDTETGDMKRASITMFTEIAARSLRLAALLASMGLAEKARGYNRVAEAATRAIDDLRALEN